MTPVLMDEMAAEELKPCLPYSLAGNWGWLLISRYVQGRARLRSHRACGSG